MAARSEYLRLIAELDRVLALVRSLWLRATAAEERIKWRLRLDGLLDERLRLMQGRDAAPPQFAPGPRAPV